MFKRIYIFLLVIVAILVGVFEKNYFFVNKHDPVMGNIDLYVKPEEIPELEENARNGDLKAARKLAQHYGFIELNSNKHAEWLLYAAERGDAWSQHNLGMLYLYDSEIIDVDKGKFWLQKAADAGDEKAKEALKTLKVR